MHSPERPYSPHHGGQTAATGGYAGPASTAKPPWWKRPWVLIVGGLLLLGIIGAAISPADPSQTGSGGDGASVEKGNGGGGSGGGGEGGGDEAKTASVGDKLTLKGTTYEVTDVSTESSIGDKSIGFDEQASGIYVIVKLDLTNRKDEPATIIEDNIRLIGGNGKNYSTSDDAILALDDQSFVFEEIQPDNTESGSLVYDIPESATSGAKLQVEDLFSGDTGEVKLGL